MSDEKTWKVDIDEDGGKGPRVSIKHGVGDDREPVAYVQDLCDVLVSDYDGSTWRSIEVQSECGDVRIDTGENFIELDADGASRLAITLAHASLACHGYAMRDGGAPQDGDVLAVGHLQLCVEQSEVDAVDELVREIFDCEHDNIDPAALASIKTQLHLVYSHGEAERMHAALRQAACTAAMDKANAALPGNFMLMRWVRGRLVRIDYNNPGDGTCTIVLDPKCGEGDDWGDESTWRTYFAEHSAIKGEFSFDTTRWLVAPMFAPGVGGTGAYGVRWCILGASDGGDDE
ncbi:MAG: hypothetical protein CL489_06995 [Acidobacteria bacterium]|nr:hypothetical protein [Acidobacteriota bacterium]